MDPSAQQQQQQQHQQKQPQQQQPVSSLPPATSAARQLAPSPSSLRPPGFPTLSSGTVSSKHIQWVSELRLVRGRWWSEVRGPWTPVENDYFEFTYELFHTGLLFGVEVGLPVRHFMSDLLGCSVKRIDLKLLDDKRIRDLRCPSCPLRELSDFERNALTNKLVRLETAFLRRERRPLHERVRYNETDDLPPFMYTEPHAGEGVHDESASPRLSSAGPPTGGMPATSAAGSRLPPPHAAHASSSQRRPSFERRSDASRATAAPPVFAAQPAHPAARPPVTSPPGSTAQPSVRKAPSAGAAQPPRAGTCKPPGGVNHAAQQNAAGRPQLHANGRTTGSASSARDANNQGLNHDHGSVPARTGVSAASAAAFGAGRGARPENNGSHQVSPEAAADVTRASPPASSTTLPQPAADRADLNGRQRSHSAGKRPERSQDHHGTASVAAAPAAPPTASASGAASSPRNIPTANGLEGRALGQQLLGVARRGGGGEEHPPAQRRRTAGYTRSAAPPVGASESRMNGDAREGDPFETPEDVAAVEYLKWELHGKFMAFPGEHYHDLLSNLASEIYHNRYPVEHGVDILHGVMRDAGPEALQRSAAALKRKNLPSKMML